MKINSRTLVRLKKVYVADNPVAPTATPEVWTLGQENTGVSPYLGYEVEGYVQGEIVSGKPLTLLRTKRNGVESTGIFQTSTLRAVNPMPNGLALWTENSIYELRIVDPADPV